MTTIVNAFAAGAAGLALGLAASGAILAGSAPFSEVSIGPWRVAVKAGSLDADPYTRAALERSGQIPLALGEGLQLVARVDSDRRPLDRRCLYRVGSRTPAARYWSLSLVDGNGFPVENAAGRYGFRSSEILRQSDGGFAVYVSELAHSGNWLPIGHVQDFALVLRLYDTPLAASAGGIDKTTAPTIVNEGCA